MAALPMHGSPSGTDPAFRRHLAIPRPPASGSALVKERMNDASTQVEYRPERGRYEMTQQGQIIGFMETIDRGSAVAVPYVEVSPEYRGKSFGERLVRAALEDLKARGRKVIPICPYVAAFLRRNREFADLLA